MTNNEEEYDEITVDELLAQGEPDFVEGVTDDLTFTARADSPYQDPRVIERTQDALLEHLWQINGLLASRAEDPTCTPEKWGSMVRFRSLLLFAIQHTERRIYRAEHSLRKSVSLWKSALHDFAVEVSEIPQAEHLLDTFVIKFPSGDMSLRDYVDIRCAKDPSRFSPQAAARAAA